MTKTSSANKVEPGFQPGKYSAQLVSKITGQESSEQWIDAMDR